MIAELIDGFFPMKSKRSEIRQALQSDAEEMRIFFSRLSRETLYMRFHIPYREVPDWALRPFLGVGLDGECLVAVEGERIIGHAMYAVEPNGREAEVALVVEDARQGRGVGKLMLRELVRNVELRGIETFSCRTMPENDRVPGLVRAVFGEMTEEFDDGMRVIHSPLRSLRVEGRR